MERHYIVFVEFAAPRDGRKPLTQTIDVHSAGNEFNVLLQALNASPDIAALNVYCKGINKVAHGLTPMTRQDLGYNDDSMEKLK